MTRNQSVGQSVWPEMETYLLRVLLSDPRNVQGNSQVPLVSFSTGTGLAILNMLAAVTKTVGRAAVFGFAVTDVSFPSASLMVEMFQFSARKSESLSSVSTWSLAWAAKSSRLVILQIAANLLSRVPSDAACRHGSWAFGIVLGSPPGASTSSFAWSVTLRSSLADIHV